MKYTLQALERDLSFEINLGDELSPVFVTAAPGQYKSTLASALFMTLGGDPTANKDSIPRGGFRGAFPSLVWLGEGTSAVVELAEDKRWKTLFHPHGDDGPNVMTYTGNADNRTVGYVGGLGNVMFLKNCERNLHLKNAVTRMQHAASVLHTLSPLASIPAEGNVSLLRYLNSATPPAFSTLLSIYSVLSAITLCQFAILDMANPGFGPKAWQKWLEMIVGICRKKECKLIMFGYEHDFVFERFTPIIRH